MAMPRPINEKMRRFADEWLTGEHTGKAFNGVAAYKHAGYAIQDQNPSGNPSKLLRHPGVQEYIRKRLEEHAMSAQEVLFRFTEIARSQVGDVVAKDINNRLTIDPDKVLENQRFIRNFGFDSNGNPKIEFHDSLEALKQIARVLGMLKDGLEVTGTGGGPVKLQVEFVDPDGSTVNLGPTNASEENTEPAEDYSEFEDD